MPTLMPFPDILKTQNKARLNGFTLVELLVVLAIMSLAAILFISASGNSGGIDKKAEIVELESAIAFTRKTAIQQASAKALDLAPYAVSLNPQLGESKKLIFYADGSSNGGVIASHKQRLFAVRWIDGAISQ